MRISFTGGAWISGSSYGTLQSGAPQELPEIGTLFPRVPARLGRFDDFTKFGFTAIGLALREAGCTPQKETQTVGLIISTEYGVMQTDLSYYATTIEQDGLLSSPNLFSYTLPVTVIGECAGFFHLTGPTFCIDDDGRCGVNAVEAAMLLLHGKQADRMIAAWIESPPDLPDSRMKRSGAAAVVLQPNDVDDSMTSQQVAMRDIKTVDSLFSLFSYLRSNLPVD
jgi:3-oxoacyl-(acyl-carrier-protein) synthase